MVTLILVVIVKEINNLESIPDMLADMVWAMHKHESIQSRVISVMDASRGEPEFNREFHCKSNVYTGEDACVGNGLCLH